MSLGALACFPLEAVSVRPEQQDVGNPREAPGEEVPAHATYVTSLIEPGGAGHLLCWAPVGWLLDLTQPGGVMVWKAIE